MSPYPFPQLEAAEARPIEVALGVEAPVMNVEVENEMCQAREASIPHQPQAEEVVAVTVVEALIGAVTTRPR